MAAPTITALTASPNRRRAATLTAPAPHARARSCRQIGVRWGSWSRSRRLDGADQCVELARRIANLMRELANDLQRLLGLADLDQLADEILVVLQRVQQANELRAGVIELLGRALGLHLELLPLVDEKGPFFRLEPVVLRQRLELVVDMVERLDAE